MSCTQSGDLEIGPWAVISMGHDWQTGYEIGTTVPVSGEGKALPPDTYTYIVAIFQGERHQGSGKKWSASGARQDTQIDFTLPLPPAVEYQWPPISLGGSGGNSGGGA